MSDKLEFKKCQVEAPDDRDVLAKLNQEISEGLVKPMRHEGLRFTSEKGEEKVILLYKNLRNRLTPEQYFSYLSSNLETPEHVWLAVSGLRWVQNGGGQDLLKEPHKTFVEGGGDCDNLALVAKKLLDDLGCRKGFNYNARVIGNSAGQHAVCVFTDKDRKMYVMDEKSEIREVPGKDIYRASPRFKRFEDPKQDNIYEEFLGPEGKFRVQIFLNEKTLALKKNWIVLQIFNYKYDEKSFNLKNYLPGSLVGGVVEVNFVDGQSVFFRGGRWAQENMPDGSQIRKVSGKLIRTYPESHALISEILDPKTRQILQRTFRHKFYGRYAIEWYDKEGNMIKRQGWDGKIEKL